MRKILVMVMCALALTLTASAAGGALQIFGGKDHKVFIGCLTCSKYDSDSVFNMYGSFGGRYSSTSIINSYSDYGSRYSSYSACNVYASDPPIVTGGEGGYYGKLTLNTFARDAITNSTIVAWLTGVCSGR